MRYHLNSSWMWGCVVLALAVPAAAVPVVADEAGQWFGEPFWSPSPARR